MDMKKPDAVEIPPRKDHVESVVEERGVLYAVDNFPKYAKSDAIGRLLTRYELFRRVLDVKGCIVECGVFSGSGVMTWMHLCELMEPAAHFRHIIGFDTFAGFPDVTDKDGSFDASRKGGVADDSYVDTQRCIDRLYYRNRIRMDVDERRYAVTYPWPKASLVKGDFMETADPFIKENKQFIVALLYLDFDLYEPTKKAIEVFLPRMPKGSIIAFDEINNFVWPGETEAVMDTIGINKLRLKQFPFDMSVSYAVID